MESGVDLTGLRQAILDAADRIREGEAILERAAIEMQNGEDMISSAYLGVLQYGVLGGSGAVGTSQASGSNRSNSTVRNINTTPSNQLLKKSFSAGPAMETPTITAQCSQTLPSKKLPNRMEIADNVKKKGKPKELGDGLGEALVENTDIQAPEAIEPDEPQTSQQGNQRTSKGRKISPPSNRSQDEGYQMHPRGHKKRRVEVDDHLSQDDSGTERNDVDEEDIAVKKNKGKGSRLSNTQRNESSRTNKASDDTNDGNDSSQRRSGKRAQSSKADNIDEMNQDDSVTEGNYVDEGDIAVKKKNGKGSRLSNTHRCGSSSANQASDDTNSDDEGSSQRGSEKRPQSSKPHTDIDGMDQEESGRANKASDNHSSQRGSGKRPQSSKPHTDIDGLDQEESGRANKAADSQSSQRGYGKRAQSSKPDTDTDRMYQDDSGTEGNDVDEGDIAVKKKRGRGSRLSNTHRCGSSRTNQASDDTNSDDEGSSQRGSGKRAQSSKPHTDTDVMNQEKSERANKASDNHSSQRGSGKRAQSSKPHTDIDGMDQEESGRANKAADNQSSQRGYGKRAQSSKPDTDTDRMDQDDSGTEGNDVDEGDMAVKKKRGRGSKLSNTHRNESSSANRASDDTNNDGKDSSQRGPGKRAQPSKSHTDIDGMNQDGSGTEGNDVDEGDIAVTRKKGKGSRLSNTHRNESSRANKASDNHSSQKGSGKRAQSSKPHTEKDGMDQVEPESANEASDVANNDGNDSSQRGSGENVQSSQPDTDTERMDQEESERNSEDVPRHREGNTYYPTLEDMTDKNYLRRILENGAEKDYGITKLIPPAGWSPCEDGIFKVDLDQLVTGIKQKVIESTRNSMAYSRTIEECGIRLGAFKDAAAPFDMESGETGCQSTDEQEMALFEHIRTKDPMYVIDNPGSHFKKYGKGLNLNKLCPIVQAFGKITGITTPMRYFGQGSTCFCIHKEDMDLHSINYLHEGKPKVWYSIGEEYVEKFVALLRGIFVEKFKGCQEVLRHKTLLVHPALLHANNIQYTRMVQHAGEFIVTMPQGYHFGFNVGYNVAEAVNFATPYWYEHGMKARRCRCSEFQQEQVYFSKKEIEEAFMKAYKNTGRKAVALYNGQKKQGGGLRFEEVLAQCNEKYEEEEKKKLKKKRREYNEKYRNNKINKKDQ